MVVSAHPQGSLTGVRILQEGGNAVDAAVATGFALAVCYPEAGNIGGGGFMVIRTSDGSADVIDFREKAPLGASRDMYLDDDGNVIEGSSTEAHLAAGVPGSVDGLIKIHSKYGRLSFRKVIQPAIDLAKNGYSLTEEQARSLNDNREYFIRKNKNKPAFVKDTEWKAGDILKQPDLSETLERIRDHGRDGFYSGETAQLILQEIKRGNGIITEQDLSEYESVFREPLITEYRGCRLITVPPPSGGGIILFQLLGIVESYPLEEWGFHSVKSIHLITEAERRVYADRAEFSGDPDFINVPVAGLLDHEYLTGRLADFDENKASLSAEIRAGSPEGYVSEETTHYSVVDENGNAVAVTTTLNNIYGSSIIVDGAGFFLNNEMNDFSVKPGIPNIFGLTGGDANAIEPGKRMLSSMTPVIVDKDGKLFLVAGSPGGSTIPTSVFQVIINVIDHNMGIREAVDTGRFHHQWLPDWISYEADGIDSLTLLKLKHLGHETMLRQSIGRVNAIQVLPDGGLAGGADKRGNNTACSY
ncbi:MAG: gamma-glutamyltransferase [Bacteroidetes bacterium RBG_13_43_22]|nr:MAG: gamma-glutamyltransferase [Bacteroidetes bacterium RBG_13_43_22]